MANHVRRQIREAVAARLTGLVTTGSRVYVNNVDPLAINELPAITIRNGSEQIERRSLGQPNPYISRAQTLIVTAHARASSAVWDTIDQIAKEVEIAMLGTLDALQLGGLALDTLLVALDDPRISGEGDRLVASLDMQFQILINAREGIPDAVI
jgi:hypothetical protein